jgi:segregation and condensation protein B
MEESVKKHYKGILEALLFVSEKPVALEQIKEVVKELTLADIRMLALELQRDHEEREGGMTIVEIAGGFQMLSNSQYATHVREFFKTKHKEKLSRPALETLAIIAYKQPVTRADVEIIRGVNSDGVVAHLLDKGLIKFTGRKDIPGRPYLYGTTKQFLEYFGLKALEDLPKLEDFPALQAKEETNSEKELTDSPRGDVDLERKTESIEESQVESANLPEKFSEGEDNESDQMKEEKFVQESPAAANSTEPEQDMSVTLETLEEGKTNESI